MHERVATGSQPPPSIERLMAHARAAPLLARHGRAATLAAVRLAVEEARAAWRAGAGEAATGPDSVLAAADAALARAATPSLRPVLNLTGTVLHTNLGRAALPEEAIAAMAEVARGGSTLEFDLARGARGDRDTHVEARLAALTGAQAATIVNNNAAAVLLVLDTLAKRREVIVSRGELVEIGGSFRMPDVMRAAGAKLREVGTTNRTHLDDVTEAIGPLTGLVMKVHASNYEIRGFTAQPRERDLARVARQADVPFVVDLGSGAFVDLSRHGLPREPLVSEAIAAGADLVTFSGDKLLGGPQAGIVVGRRDLVARLKRNPLKRALRCDKLGLAALEAVLRLYDDPDRLAERLPTLRQLARPQAQIASVAQRLLPAFDAALGEILRVEVVACASRIGSGALPVESLPSAGLSLSPLRRRPSASRIAAALRALPLPVIGRITEGAVLLDLRTLEHEEALVEMLPTLAAALRETGR